MSFLKISDPKRRDSIVEEFLKTKANIKRNDLAEKLGDINLSRELTKHYSPIVTVQSEIVKELKTIKESADATTNALQSLPAAIQYHQVPAIKDNDDNDPVEDIRTLELGNIASEYMHQYASNKKNTDTTFGINSKDGVLFIGESPIKISGDNIQVGEKIYHGTPGLWELVTMKSPDTNKYDNDDLDNYAEILDETNAIRQPSNPNRPKASKSNKYREIIKPIWQKFAHGKGLNTSVVILPSDPNALIEMLELRLASFNAGNTGVRNDIVSICDELLRQQVIDKNYYKKIMLQL